MVFCPIPVSWPILLLRLDARDQGTSFDGTVLQSSGAVLFGRLRLLLRDSLCSIHRRMPSRLLGTPCRTGHRSETWAIPSLCRATPSATSEHLVELLGSSPIPRSFVASCVSFQLRPLPSPGVTRLHRYNEPLRHPKRPGLSLASCQLIHTAITAGTSRVALGPHCLHAVANTPAGQMEFIRSYDSIRFGLPTNRGGSAPALSVSGPTQRSLTLRPTCSPSRLCDSLDQRLQQSRCLHCCSDCYRVERTSSRAGIPPLWTTAFSRRTRFADYSRSIHVASAARRSSAKRSCVPSGSGAFSGATHSRGEPAASSKRATST
jgi:hypothetical protein